MTTKPRLEHPTAFLKLCPVMHTYLRLPNPLNVPCSTCQLKPALDPMSDQNNVFLLRKYGDNWTAAHLSLMEYQLKELEAQTQAAYLQVQASALQQQVPKEAVAAPLRWSGRARWTSTTS